MQLLTLGLNHTTAQVAVRERLALESSAVGKALADLRARLAPIVCESAILSTCNRTELYCAVSQPTEAQGALLEWLSGVSAIEPERLRPHLYALPQDGAVRHAFRVASGLDSMVLGEPQILGQMKHAWRQARDAGALGVHLEQLFQRSFAVAKEVRSETGISLASVSMAAAAVRLARTVFADLGKTRVLLLGAGDMVGLAAVHFAAQHPVEMVIANRTLERAERVARRCGARTMRLQEVPDRLADFDVVVTGTASSLPIIGLGMVERASRERDRPLVLIDLAMPRDVEPEAGRVANVFLYNLDDLERAVQCGVASRRVAAAQAEAIIETRVASFMRWLAARRTVPVIRALEARAEAMRRAELERARRMLARGEPVETTLEALSSGLLNKFLHAPRALLAGGALLPEEARRLVDHWVPEGAMSSTIDAATGQRRIRP